MMTELTFPQYRASAADLAGDAWVKPLRRRHARITGSAVFPIMWRIGEMVGLMTECSVVVGR
jgi:hypothetical protein